MEVLPDEKTTVRSNSDRLLVAPGFGVRLDSVQPFGEREL
jgi:hypothetical protein